MTVICPKCGNENTDKAERCMSCGADLTEETVALSSEEKEKTGSRILLSLEPRKKKLILIFPENITETFELKSGRYRIGRHEENDIFLNDLTVSRSHAEIEITGSEAIIKDLGSLNGTFVNGSIIEKPTPLKDGDVVQIGRFKLLFRTGGVEGNE